MPFDQFDAHLIGQKAVFVIGRVVDARGQDHHTGPAIAGPAGADASSERRRFLG